MFVGCRGFVITIYLINYKNKLVFNNKLMFVFKNDSCFASLFKKYPQQRIYIIYIICIQQFVNYNDKYYLVAYLIQLLLTLSNICKYYIIFTLYDTINNNYCSNKFISYTRFI